MATAQLTPVGVGIHNVLIATDFSRCSNAALEFGLQLARGCNAATYIVFVVPNDQFLLAGPEAYVAAKDAAQRDLESLKFELQKTHPEAKDCHFFLLDGDVAQCVLDLARQNKGDLIVLGTHGRGGLGRAILGSVAERVFRNSTVPVLTIGPYCCRATEALAPANILVPVDFTPASERAIGYAVALAGEHKSKLTLLHVIDPKAARQSEHKRTEAKAKLVALVGGEVRVACDLRVEMGRVVPTVIKVAEEIAADLLVMGVRPPTGVLDRFAWPNAYEAVRQASCPVLTVRNGEK
jgi:nucleotide-binding universal stress UspA family protein